MQGWTTAVVVALVAVALARIHTATALEVDAYGPGPFTIQGTAATCDFTPSGGQLHLPTTAVLSEFQGTITAFNVIAGQSETKIGHWSVVFAEGPNFGECIDGQVRLEGPSHPGLGQVLATHP